jgi:hypothetical protein
MKNNKKLEVPVIMNFETSKVDGQIGVMVLDEKRVPMEFLPKARFVPTLKVLEFEMQKDGTKIIKKAELLALSLVFDK